METVWIGAIVIILIFVFRLSGQKLHERQRGLQTSSEKQPSAEGVDRPHRDKDGNSAPLAVAYKKALVSLNAVELMSGITRDLEGNSRKA